MNKIDWFGSVRLAVFLLHLYIICSGGKGHYRYLNKFLNEFVMCILLTFFSSIQNILATRLLKYYYLSLANAFSSEVLKIKNVRFSGHKSKKCVSVFEACEIYEFYFYTKQTNWNCRLSFQQRSTNKRTRIGTTRYVYHFSYYFSLTGWLNL